MRGEPALSGQTYGPAGGAGRPAVPDAPNGAHLTVPAVDASLLYEGGDRVSSERRRGHPAHPAWPLGHLRRRRTQRRSSRCSTCRRASDGPGR
jgi:hypothetical protein